MANSSLTRPVDAPILERPVFERLLFAQCWEDPRMDIEALRPGPGQTVVVVTSGGCTALALALCGPAKVIAVDLNAAQSWLLHLKIAGARALSHDEYLELLGVRPSPRRYDLYTRCRLYLPPRARAYWDREGDRVEAGVLASGRYERYLATFRGLLRVLHGEKRIARLFERRDLDEQRRFYEDEWDTAAWRLFFRIFFSRTVLGMAGLDRAFFTYVEGIPDFGAHFLGRARHALVDLPTSENYFLAQICLGRYDERLALPPYLQPGNFERLKAAVRRIEVVTDELGTLLARLPESSIDGFAFSNVFEWVSPETFHALLRRTHRASRHGARLCYRNLLVRRRHPASLDGLFAPNDALAARLLSEDRSFVYSHFEIATAVKPTRAESGRSLDIEERGARCERT
jgi:S-adenosylmethionine-diacylglycerol 3-amino-3-carboxypropyl transferase